DRFAGRLSGQLADGSGVGCGTRDAFGAATAFAAAGLAHLLGMRLSLLFLNIPDRRARLVFGHDIREQTIKADGFEAGGEMFGRLSRNIELAPFGMIDADAAAVQMQLAADRAGEKRALAAIFAVAND